MHVVSIGSKLLEEIKHSPPALRYSISVGMIAVFIGVWYVLFYRPYSVSISFYEHENQVLKTKQARFSRFVKKMEQQAQKIIEFERELGSQKKKLTAHVTPLIEKVLLAVKKQHLVVQAWRCDAQEEVRDISAFRYQCVVTGSYEHLAHFFQEIESMYPSISCMQADFTKKEGLLACAVSICFLGIKESR